MIGRTVAWGVVLALVATGAVACGSDGEPESSGQGATTIASGPAGDRGGSGRWLGSLSAAGGTWGEPEADGARTLTLTGVDDHVVVFEDRPARGAGIVATASAVDHWDDVFGDDPPNAVLVEHDAERERGSASTVVTLTEPSYDAGEGVLQLRAERVRNEEQAGENSGREADLPASFEAASLFIDAVYTNAYDNNPFEYMAYKNAGRWPPP